MSNSTLLGTDGLSRSALILLGRKSSLQATESKKESNLDNYNENSLSPWDAVVGAEVGRTNAIIGTIIYLIIQIGMIVTIFIK